jgi:FkbM family methyltransferase
MSNPVGLFFKKAIVGKAKNLVSLDDPFARMQRLMRGKRVTGILDAGASHGRISRKLLTRFPEADVFAFEPNSLHSETLQQFAREESRFHPYPIALSDEKGRARLNLTTAPGSTSLLTPNRQMRELFSADAVVEGSMEVDVTTIDDWVQSQGNPPLQIMKFDIQGAELRALRGATHTLGESTALIYIELWFNPGYEEGALYGEVDSFLRTQGFVLFDIYKPKYDPHGVLTWANAIFVNPGRVSVPQSPAVAPSPNAV